MKKDMRYAVTERMLREGMLRCLKAKPLSKITVSDLCRESGINRATFYNHYESPVLILRSIAYEYAEQISGIFEKNPKGNDAGLEACLTYLSERKQEIKVLFSNHAEHYLSGICLEIINEKAVQKASAASALDRRDEFLLSAAASASAVYGFIQIWITKDIEKTPKELVAILKKVSYGTIL